MRGVSIIARAPEHRDRMAERLEVAAGVLGGYTVSEQGDSIVLERTETAWWMLGVLAPLFKRRHMIVVTVDNGQVRAVGHDTGAMVAFLEAYLLDEPRPTLSRRLRELANGWTPGPRDDAATRVRDHLSRGA